LVEAHAEEWKEAMRQVLLCAISLESCDALTANADEAFLKCRDCHADAPSPGRYRGRRSQGRWITMRRSLAPFSGPDH